MSGFASIALAASMSSSVSFGGRPPVRPTRRGGEARLGALADQAALEFRQRPEHVKDQPALYKRLTARVRYARLRHHAVVEDVDYRNGRARIGASDWSAPAPGQQVEWW